MLRRKDAAPLAALGAVFLMVAPVIALYLLVAAIDCFGPPESCNAFYEQYRIGATLGIIGSLIPGTLLLAWAFLCRSMGSEKPRNR